MKFLLIMLNYVIQMSQFFFGGTPQIQGVHPRGKLTRRRETFALISPNSLLRIDVLNKFCQI